jgi:hypothetical protein
LGTASAICEVNGETDIQTSIDRLNDFVFFLILRAQYVLSILSGAYREAHKPASTSTER